MELNGKVKKITDIQTFASGFQKRELIILTEEQYPQPISIEFVQDKVDLCDRLKEGDDVTVKINIRGREWTSPQGDVKYFNSIVGWQVINKTVDQPTEAKPNNTATPEQAFDKPSTADIFAEDDDDLPF